MSSSGRTPLPEWQPRHKASRKASRKPTRMPLSGRRLRSIEDEDIDHAQLPAAASADGVVLTNGKFRCGICCSQMMNTAKSIRSHNSKLHPKDPTKPSAYLKRLERRPTPCGECGKICTSEEMLFKHVKQEHRGEEQSAQSSGSASVTTTQGENKE